MPHWIWYVLAAIAVAAYFTVRWRENQKTHRDYAALATRLGWRYEKYSTDFNKRYRKHPPFDAGKLPRADHLFHGKYRGRPLTIFQYSAEFEYSEGTPSKREHWQVVSFVLAARAPAMEVRPRGALGRLALRAGFGANTGDADFDRRYAVRSEDDGFTATVLNKEVRAYLRSTKHDANLLVTGNDAVTWREGQLYPDDMEPWADFLADVLDRAGLK